MSEFDRAEQLRRSIRRPKKAPAPPPPVTHPIPLSNATPKSPIITKSFLTSKLPTTKHTPTPTTTSEDVSAIIKRLLITKRDFVANTAPHNNDVRPTTVHTSPIPSPTTTTAISPRVVSHVPKTTSNADDDSQSALLAIQKHINAIEFNQKVHEIEQEQQPQIPIIPVRKTRYDEMESLLNTGISDLATNQHDTDDECDSGIQFQRGGGTRSSVQGVPSQNTDAKKLKMPRPAARTASDTKQHEMLRNLFKNVGGKKTESDDQAKKAKVKMEGGDNDWKRETWG